MRGIVAVRERFGRQVQCGRHWSRGSTLALIPARQQWRPLSSSSPPHANISEDSDSEWTIASTSAGRRGRFSHSKPSGNIWGSPNVLEGGPVKSPHHHRQSLKAQDYTQLITEFRTVVQDGQPDQVMDTLLDPRFENLVGSVAPSAFIEVFQLLSPTYFVEPYREIHRLIHPTAALIKGYKSLDLIFDEFAQNMAHIVRIRRSAGHVLGLAEYTHLLHCAQSMGDAIMADTVWYDMKADDITPDIMCYNQYMEAKVWDTAYTGLERYRLRITPFGWRKRKYLEPNFGWRGYGTGGRSVRKEVVQIFDKMTDEGNFGDEASFVAVLMATARVGYCQGMRNVLKAAWNIDADALLDKGVSPSNMPPVTKLERHSPFYPTERLLFAVAHGFGINSDVPGALKLVEFIASSYDITIPEKVWHEIFERSFQLSSRKFGRDVERNERGKLSHDFVNNLAEAMKLNPFNIRPTMKIHLSRAKSAWVRYRLSEFRPFMNAAYDMLLETRRKRRLARTVLEVYLGNPMPNGTARTGNFDKKLLKSRTFADAVHSYDILRLQVAQQTLAMERLAKLLWINGRWLHRHNVEWERLLLPQALEEWQDFLPEYLIYPTTGGEVKIMGPTDFGQRRLNTHPFVPVRHPTAANGLKPSEEARELDDDFFWDAFLQSLPCFDIKLPALQRLFTGVSERAHGDRVLPPDDSLEKQQAGIYDYRNHRRQMRERMWMRRKQAASRAKRIHPH